MTFHPQDPRAFVGKDLEKIEIYARLGTTKPGYRRIAKLAPASGYHRRLYKYEIEIASAPTVISKTWLKADEFVFTQGGLQ